MSEIKVEVVPVVLSKHPNADNLSIATVKGWQCVVKTLDFQDPATGKDIKLGAYIPIGAKLPETEEWAFLAPHGYRIHTIKLRDYVSQGLLIPAWEGWHLGEDVTQELGVTKYEPPIPVNMSGPYIVAPVEFQKYTDIQQFNDYTRLFTANDDVIVTEKIHGTCARFSIVDGTFYVGGHNYCFDPACAAENLYWQVATRYDVEAKLRAGYPAADIVVYGEIYGEKVQDLTYGRTDPYGLAVFDILIGGRYQPYSQLLRFSQKSGIPLVPMLYRGKFNSLVLKHRDGQSVLDPGTIREGIVIRSESEPFHPQLGRKILKMLSEQYLLLKGRTEYH